MPFYSVLEDNNFSWLLNLSEVDVTNLMNKLKLLYYEVLLHRWAMWPMGLFFHFIFMFHAVIWLQYCRYWANNYSFNHFHHQYCRNCANHYAGNQSYSPPRCPLPHVTYQSSKGDSCNEVPITPFDKNMKFKVKIGARLIYDTLKQPFQPSSPN